VSLTGQVVKVRDSRNQSGPVQFWTIDDWTQLLAAVRAGRLHSGLRPVAMSGVEFGMPGHGRLTLRADEWLAFVGGVMNGEFDIAALAAKSCASGQRSVIADRLETTAEIGVVAPAPISAVAGRRDCIACGRPTIVARYVDNHPVVMEAEPVTDGQAVLKGDLSDQPVALFGIEDEHDASFWNVPFESDRYDRHECTAVARAAVAGMNVANYDSPAGRSGNAHEAASTCGGCADTSAGQPGALPGREPWDPPEVYVAEQIAQALEADGSDWAARVAREVGRRLAGLDDETVALPPAPPELVEYWQKAIAPLVPPIPDEPPRSQPTVEGAAGSVSVGTSGTAEEGSVGPTSPVGGPAEPAGEAS
jgi:hypothetical protein